MDPTAPSALVADGRQALTSRTVIRIDFPVSGSRFASIRPAVPAPTMQTSVLNSTGVFGLNCTCCETRIGSRRSSPSLRSGRLTHAIHGARPSGALRASKSAILPICRIAGCWRSRSAPGHQFNSVHESAWLRQRQLTFSQACSVEKRSFIQSATARVAESFLRCR